MTAVLPLDERERTDTEALDAYSRGEVCFCRRYLGIAGGYRALPPRLATRLGRRAGVGIAEVIEQGPAERGGLLVKDIILTAGRRPGRLSGCS